MPYPGEHAARIIEPSKFIPDSFRRKNIATGIDIIIGKLKDGNDSMVTQAYRFKIENFTEEQARKWLKDHDIKYISFEPAKKEKKSAQNDLIEKRFVLNGEDTKIDSDKRLLEGYAAVYDSDSQPIAGLFIERIMPGAFKKTIMESDIICTRDHEDGKILGRIKAGTLKLMEDQHGLKYQCELPDTTYANDLKESIKRGDVRGNSFEFRAIKDKWTYPTNPKDPVIREIQEAQLYQVGPVTNPAYTKTSIGLRSRNDELDIDFDRFQFIFLKKSRGLTLDKDEITFVEGIFNKFSLESREEPIENHSEDEPIVDDHSHETEPEDRSILERVERMRRINKITLGV